MNQEMENTMSKLTSLIRRAPKRFSALAIMIAAAVIVPAAVFAFGPSRPTFTQAHPANYVTFDSITDNPQLGDERNFVRIKEDGTSTYGDNVNLTPGKVYDVSVYFHNNAAANLNLVANNTTLKMEVPGVVNAGVNAALTGTISSSNANPTSVWDEAYGKNATSGQVALRYVSNSATFVSNGAINGQTLPDTLFTTGAKLGYNAQDGNVPGCNQFAGFVNFKFRVDQPNFTVSKMVSTNNGTTWSKTATAQPGANVMYGLSFQNTGTTQLDNVILRDMLPTGVSYVAGSSFIENSVTGGQFKPTIDGITSSTGVNVGSYQPKGNVFYKFSAKLPTEDKLQCGTNNLVNTVRATTSAGFKEDTATVTLNKECKPPVKITVCELATQKIVTIDESAFDSSKYSKNLQDCVVKKITVCQLDTKTIVTINEKDFDSSKYSKNLEDCKTPNKIIVCKLDTKTIVTIDEKDFDSSKYSKNLDDCKTPEQMNVCDLSTKQIVTINKADFDSTKFSTDLSLCTTTPPELPHTGASDNIVAVIGLGAIVAGVAYYIASRRALGL
jgi:uncharacterized repeat protein (TIGR01451 family)/LPXTG-motif cell wall-anchored protein